MNKTLLHIIRFVVLVLVQVLLVNHIRLGGYVHPYVYILFVMLLPINISNWQLLLLGFGLGFCVDMFTGTPWASRRSHHFDGILPSGHLAFGFGKPKAGKRP